MFYVCSDYGIEANFLTFAEAKEYLDELYMELKNNGTPVDLWITTD